MKARKRQRLNDSEFSTNHIRQKTLAKHVVMVDGEAKPVPPLSPEKMACTDECKDKNNTFSYTKEWTICSSIKSEVISEPSSDAENGTDYKNHSDNLRIIKSTVVKIENEDEETFDSFVIDYENDQEPQKQSSTADEPKSKSIEVQTQDEVFSKMANVKTRPRVGAKVSTFNCKKKKMKRKKFTKVKKSATRVKKSATRNSESSPRLSVYPYILEQAKRLSERSKALFPLPSLINFSTIKSKSSLLSLANCARDRKMNKPEDEAGTHNASITGTLAVNIEKQEDGKLVDSFILNENNKEQYRQTQMANGNADKPSHERVISSIEDCRNKDDATSREERTKNKRKLAYSFMIPENCKNDQKLVADVAVKLKRLDKCTGDLHVAFGDELVRAPCDNSSPSNTSVQIKTEPTDTDEVKLETVEKGVEEEPIQLERIETGEITTDHIEILEQQEQEGFIREPEETLELKSDLTENETVTVEPNETIEVKSEPIEKNGFAAESISPDLETNYIHPTDYMYIEGKPDTCTVGKADGIQSSNDHILHPDQGDGYTLVLTNIPTITVQDFSKEKTYIKKYIKWQLEKTTSNNAEKILTELKTFLRQQLIDTLTSELENRLCSPTSHEQRNVTLHQGLREINQKLTDEFRIFFLREINRLLYRWNKSISIDEKLEIVNKLSADLDTKLHKYIAKEVQSETVKNALKLAENRLLRSAKTDPRENQPSQLKSMFQLSKILSNQTDGQTGHMINDLSQNGSNTCKEQRHYKGIPITRFTDQTPLLKLSTKGTLDLPRLDMKEKQPSASVPDADKEKTQQTVTQNSDKTSILTESPNCGTGINTPMRSIFPVYSEKNRGTEKSFVPAKDTLTYNSNMEESEPTIYKRTKQKSAKGKATKQKAVKLMGTNKKAVKRKYTKQKVVEQKATTSLSSSGCVLCEGSKKDKLITNCSSSAFTTYAALTRLRPRKVQVKDKEIVEKKSEKRTNSENILKTLEFMKVWTVQQNPVPSSSQNS